MKYQQLKMIGVSLVWWLVGCSNTVTHSVPDTRPYIEQPVAIFGASAPSSLSIDLWRRVMSHVEKRLVPFPSFSRVLPETTVDQEISGTPGLANKKRIYSTTLALTGISDRDLSYELLTPLEVEQVLLVFLDHFPCTEQCESSEQLFIHLQLVELKTSKMIWSGHIHYELPEEETLASKQFDATVIELVDELLTDFIAEFVVPWHRLRYQGLANLKD